MTARYDIIGDQYDTTRRADPYLTQRLLHHLDPQPDGRYLDIACGSGNYTIALNEHSVDICGVDASETMIAAARNKNETLDWQVADVTNLPYNKGSFNGAICTLATHHFEDLAHAFREIRRVLTETSRLVIFTATPDQMSGYWLNHYFPQMMARSMKQMPTLNVTTDALASASFDIVTTEPYAIQPDLQDFFLYSGKHKPAMYLDAHVRAGISSFRLLIDDDELDEGCAQLGRDIETGTIKDIYERYDNDDGDYLFINAETRE